jgi:type II secretory pathway predicted ATPase ExeA
MYLDFFGLKKEPFQITPDPEFLFLSASHREALASIIYGIEKRKGFIAIIGGVGLGKTTIFRSYLERINKRQIRTIYIFNPNVSFKCLLKTIFQEMDVEPASDDPVEMVNQLHDILIAADSLRITGSCDLFTTFSDWRHQVEAIPGLRVVDIHGPTKDGSKVKFTIALSISENKA